MTKTEEKNIFKAFLQVLNPSFDFSFKSRERPDFELLTPKEIIGVELTEILDPKRRAFQMLVKDIGDCVVNHLENFGYPKFQLSFSLHNSLRVRKSDINNYSERIAAQFIEAIGSVPLETGYSFDFDQVSEEGLINGTIIFSDALTKSLFAESMAGFLPHFNKSDLDKILSKKERAMIGYSNYDKHWLSISEN